LTEESSKLDSKIRAQFEYIELILAYEGVVTNQHVRQQFGVASVQASRILAAYRDKYPRNIQVLSGEGKGRYGPKPGFTPEIATLGIDNYFSIAAKHKHRFQIEDLRQDFTEVSPEKFRIIHKAMVDGAAVQILYRSMNHPDGVQRIIHPLAFAFAGRRWHLRAFDEMTAAHRDFNLARIFEAAEAVKSVDTPTDSDWEEVVTLDLRAHPQLSEAQKRLIRDEFFKGTAGRQVRVRRSLVKYFLREMEVAEDADKQKPPEFNLHLYSIN
jgi:predicted DNA-binding transcriptional regulator YafY